MHAAQIPALSLYKSDASAKVAEVTTNHFEEGIDGDQQLFESWEVSKAMPKKQLTTSRHSGWNQADQLNQVNRKWTFKHGRSKQQVSRLYFK